MCAEQVSRISLNIQFFLFIINLERNTCRSVLGAVFWGFFFLKKNVSVWSLEQRVGLRSRRSGARRERAAEQISVYVYLRACMHAHERLCIAVGTALCS